MSEVTAIVLSYKFSPPISSRRKEMSSLVDSDSPAPTLRTWSICLFQVRRGYGYNYQERRNFSEFPNNTRFQTQNPPRFPPVRYRQNNDRNNNRDFQHKDALINYQINPNFNQSITTQTPSDNYKYSNNSNYSFYKRHYQLNNCSSNNQVNQGYNNRENNYNNSRQNIIQCFYIRTEQNNHTQFNLELC